MAEKSKKNSQGDYRADAFAQSQEPDGLFQKCEKCGESIRAEEIVTNYHICPKCQCYFRVPPRARISMVVDKASFVEWDAGLAVSDPLNFPGYTEKLEHMRQVTGIDEAVLTGKAAIDGMPVAIGVMAASFMMGSMGEIVGEKLTRMIERATRERLPVVIFCSSGGARMQEGIVSLMQMAKTAGALKRHSEAGLYYVSVLTDPTTGGVMASFAMLGDTILAEPGALIGFAGPRVIEQTIGQKLPEGFQRAEFLLEHGFVDKIVKRDRMKKTLSFLIEANGGEKPPVARMYTAPVSPQEKVEID